MKHQLPPLVLRPYQIEVIADARERVKAGARSALIVLPTGGGKAALIAYLAQRMSAAGKRILIAAPTQEIVDHLAASLSAAGVAFGRIAPGEPDDERSVMIATVATLSRPKRRERWASWSNVVLVDEAHHGAAASWRAVLLDQCAALRFGFSATPVRADGAGLSGMFETLVVGPSVAQLIAWGFLAPFRVYAPFSPDLSSVAIRAGDYEIEGIRESMGGVVIGAAVREYQRRASGKRAVVFCVDRAHGRAVEAAFLGAGIRAQFIDGETPADERRAAIAALGANEIDVLINVSLFGEGVDIPAIETVLLLRPTLSLALCLQQIGRALRPAPGKDCALILDFAGNVERHGFPDEDRKWTLEAKPARARDRDAASVPRPRRCTACTAMNRPAVLKCAECGADLRTTAERREAEVALAEAQRRKDEDLVATLPLRDAIAWAGPDESRLRFVARARGYREGWVWHRMNEFRTEAGQ